MIHALRYTEELEKVGFSAEQAKKSLQIWMDLMDQNFATKADFKEHYFMSKTDLLDLTAKIDKVEFRLNKRCDELDAKIDKKFDELDAKIDRVEAKLDKRCDELDAKIDKKFDELDAKIDKRCDELNAKLDKKLDEVNYRFDKLESSIIIKLGVMMAASISIVSTIITLSK